MEQFPQEKEQHYRAAFEHFDKDKDGRLTLEELRVCMLSVGEHLDGARLQQMGGNGCDAGTFVNYFRQKWQGLVAQDELTNALSFFDFNGTGKVTASQELSWLLQNWGNQKLSQQEVDAFVKVAGGDTFDIRQFADKLLRGGC